MGNRPVTLCTCQWADLPFDELCALASKMGYDGLEVACWGNGIDIDRAYSDDSYVAWIKETLAKNNLICKALACHIIGQCVGDAPDPRLNNFAPAAGGDPRLGDRHHEEGPRGGQEAGLLCGHGLHRLSHLEVAVFLPPDHRGDGRERLRRDRAPVVPYPG